jgi:hypothetical protein
LATILFITINGMIYIDLFIAQNQGNKSNPKSRFGFEKWTKINVQNRKPKQSFEKDPRTCQL